MIFSELEVKKCCCDSRAWLSNVCTQSCILAMALFYSFQNVGDELF